MRKNIMDKIVSLALLIDGALFSVLGFSAMNASGAGVSQVFSGLSGSGAWMFGGGIAAAIAGLTTLVRGAKGI